VTRDLSGAVVVITGASSGIGRAAARAFSRENAQLVLAARGEERLRAVAEETGGLAVPTDVRDPAAVDALAEAAVRRFGRLDVWVNCAGVIAYGRFTDVPADVFRAVIETNFFGQVHGARASLPRFRAQRSGALINVSSVWGRVTSPDVSAYVASKFAVRAFSECLRFELRDEPGIGVATILPQPVDTPIFAAAANYAGRATRPIPPLVAPEAVAAGIVACARSPQGEVTYRRVGRILELVHALMPRLYARVLPSVFEAGNYAAAHAPHTPGNVLAPTPVAGAVRGGWRRRTGELTRALADSAAAAVRGLAGR
jgi:NAD(P)-dependent dehydrogenase (short-subunit alcohol dehydrogenase family)